jgi:hypothetical protein
VALAQRATYLEEGPMKSTKKPPARTKVATTASRAAKPVARKPALPTRQQIAGRAYEIYSNAGRQPGREVEFWLEAERQLLGGRKK